ncbi:MAG: hypothetical protein IPH94_15070 [Saprospiraceae bacterium]|nr:hypothetical protein [Saprospiraceae bacterium]
MWKLSQCQAKDPSFDTMLLKPVPTMVIEVERAEGMYLYDKDDKDI